MILIGFGWGIQNAAPYSRFDHSNFRELFERSARAGANASSFQAHSHHAVENESEKADQGMRANAIVQPVADRRYFDVALQHAKAAFDVGERLVAGDGFGGLDVLHVRHESELPVEQFGLLDFPFLRGPEEAAIVLAEPEAEEFLETGLADLDGEDGERLVVRDAAAIGILLGPGRQSSGSRLEPVDADAPVVGSLARSDGVVGDDQPAAPESRLRAIFPVLVLVPAPVLVPVALELEVREGFGQFLAAAGGHGQDEFELAAFLVDQLRKLVYIVVAEQAAVGHQNDAPDRESLHDGPRHVLQGLRLGDVAGMDHVSRRQPLGSLDRSQHELPGDTARLLALSVTPQIVLAFLLAADANRRQIVERHGRIEVDQRPGPLGELLLDAFRVLHRRVHRPQQLLMARSPGHDRNRDRLRPIDA